MNTNNNSFKQKLIVMMPLLLISLVCVLFIVFVHQLTKNKITENRQRAALAIINDVMPINYDNDIYNDKIKVDVPAYINNTNSITAYRARSNNQPVAVSLMPVITKGYNGKISLIIGIAYDGTLTGIRVISDNETEGFGDQIHQDKSDWIKGFNGHSIENTPEGKWAVKKDGGDFDQLSGATITPRSVINVVYKVLAYYAEHRDKFFL